MGLAEITNLRLILIICPFIVSVIVYYLSKLLVKHKRRAFHIMIAFTTIFYIIAVTLLLEGIFNINLIGIVPIVLLLTLSAILIVHWKTRTDVVLRNGLKILWRISFLIFVPLYICLIIYHIVTILFMS